MQFDDILRHVGVFGPYQKRICLLVMIPIVALAIDSMNVIFALATPEHRCSVASLSNDTFRSQGQWHDDLVNQSMPTEDGITSKCYTFANHSDVASTQNNSLSKCSAWVFDHSVYEVAGGEEFLLVCDRTYLRSLSTSISYSGNLMVFALGVLSDIIGRRRCFFLVVLLSAVSGAGKAFCNTVECYTALHFINAIGRTGVYMTGFVICIWCMESTVTVMVLMLAMLVEILMMTVMVLMIVMMVEILMMTLFNTWYWIYQFRTSVLSAISCLSCLSYYITLVIVFYIPAGMELAGPSKRVVVGMAADFAWIVGLLILGGLAYVLRNWHYIQLCPAAVNFLYLAMWWIIPESPRWLLAKGRSEEAKVILEKTAKVNGTDMSISELINTNSPREKLFSLLTGRTMLIRALIIYFNWFMISLDYYALTYNVTNLSGDIYLNFTIGNLAELLGYVIAFGLLHKIGRKSFHASSMIIGGAACIVTIFPVLYCDQSLAWITTALSIVGRLAICCAFATIYIYSAELFPTVVRQSAVSVCSVCATIGGIAAPYIAELGVLLGGELKSVLPLIVIGTTSLAAGVMSLWLPETLGVKLPDTVQDAIAIARNNRTTTVTDGTMPMQRLEQRKETKA
ncbi:organic cation transporter protein-like [Gigantopelta aegis]|uniref:organic cation transporter protein-like n=1 Tax=Gigantopelta aegis TaxID=1735272 RepID=UPI001B887BC0|nr:organic cation transporter protein-like [Gigantopelta aegis]